MRARIVIFGERRCPVRGTGDSADMEAHDVVLVLVVLTALAFDFTNGFHDSANAMATSLATKALEPKVAVGLAGVLNFVGAFISFMRSGARERRFC